MADNAGDMEMDVILEKAKEVNFKKVEVLIYKLKNKHEEVVKVYLGSQSIDAFRYIDDVTKKNKKKTFL